MPSNVSSLNRHPHSPILEEGSTDPQKDSIRQSDRRDTSDRQNTGKSNEANEVLGSKQGKTFMQGYSDRVSTVKASGHPEESQAEAPITLANLNK